MTYISKESFLTETRYDSATHQMLIRGRLVVFIKKLLVNGTVFHFVVRVNDLFLLSKLGIMNQKINIIADETNCVYNESGISQLPDMLPKRINNVLYGPQMELSIEERGLGRMIFEKMKKYKNNVMQVMTNVFMFCLLLIYL